jgi:predicted dehydrogenase
VPASDHFELARQALAAGKHVFIEKPIALDIADADELIALASKHGVVLQTGHQERYVFEAAGMFSRKRAPLKIDSIRCTSANGRCEDVSVALDLMVHDIDLIRHMTKAEIESVSAEGGAHDMSADIMLTNGTVVSLKATRRATSPERRMTLVYDDGVVEFDFIRREISNSTPAPLTANFSNDDTPLAFSDPLKFGANEFVSCICDNRAPHVSGLDGREALKWARHIEGAAGIAVEYKDEAMERQRA